jgi:hypothetical protein
VFVDIGPEVLARMLRVVAKMPPFASVRARAGSCINTSTQGGPIVMILDGLLEVLYAFFSVSPVPCLKFLAVLP